jgi:ATP-dependent Clp protease protease subunit
MKMKIKGKGKRAKMVAKGELGEIWIYDDIGEDWFGGISSKSFAEDLKALADVNLLTVYINSAGGSVFEGLSIYNQLKRHPANVHVEIDGLAASIASLVAMAGDSISIAENAMMMIHKPMGGAYGEADELRNVATALDKVQDVLRDTYVKRSGADDGKINDLIDAETWLTAEEALELGLVDKISEAKSLAAYCDVSRYPFKNMPKELPSAVYTVKPEAPLRSKYAKLIEMQRQQLTQLQGDRHEHPA